MVGLVSCFFVLILVTPLAYAQLIPITKSIPKMIKDFTELDFIGGGEESFGFMVGDFVRDKDAVTATLLACEIAAQAKAKGSSLYEELIQLYVKHGCYKEHLIAVTKKGIDGAREINQMMIDFRENPLVEINGSKVVMLEDYQSSIAKNLISGKEEIIEIPKSNVLIYYMQETYCACSASDWARRIN